MRFPTASALTERNTVHNWLSVVAWTRLSSKLGAEVAVVPGLCTNIPRVKVSRAVKTLNI